MSLGAAQSAVVPPRIELDLTGLAPFRLTKVSNAREDTLFQQPCDGTNNLLCGVKQSRHDYTEHCPAGPITLTNETSCPFPKPHAYDHQDKEVPVLTNVWLTDDDNNSNGLPKKVDEVLFDTRSTYLFKYDARDKAGNWAEQVVFALELNDLEPPTIRNEYGTDCPNGVTVQAAQACRVWDPDNWFQNDPSKAGGAWWKL